MRKYVVRWSEINHFESAVSANSPEEAQDLAMSNLGDWQDHEWGGVEPDSIEVEAR